MNTVSVTRSPMKKLLIASTTALILGSSLAMAEPGNKKCDGPRHGFMGEKIDRKELFQRSYNKQQIRTLTEARLIMKGNENLKVGKIKATDSGYTVNIVTQDNSLVKKLELAANGMPLERYERIQKRIEERNKNT